MTTKTACPLALWFARPIPYAGAVAFQERLVSARIAGCLPDVVLALEHPPVVTLGTRAQAEHVLGSAEDLAARGVDLVASSRGGDVTYHGPGQLVLYPILKLDGREADAHGHLVNLEEVAIRTAADFGVTAFRRPGLTGAWTVAGKIAAIGVRFRRWVSFHGMSFNVAPDLAGFSLIVPCGLAGEPVTSLSAILGPGGPSLPVVRERMFDHVRTVFRRDFLVYEAADPVLPHALAEALAMAGLLP